MRRRPRASSADALQRMRAAKQRDTGPELAIRKLVHAAGLRYYVDRRPDADVNRRADLVFPRSKVAVFIDGCFWHSCPKHGTFPKANAHWWREKLARNRERDRETNEHLIAAGWRVIRIWEHERASAAANRIIVAVRRRQLSS